MLGTIMVIRLSRFVLVEDKCFDTGNSECYLILDRCAIVEVIN